MAFEASSDGFQHDLDAHAALRQGAVRTGSGGTITSDHHGFTGRQTPDEDAALVRQQSLIHVRTGLSMGVTQYGCAAVSQ